MRAGDLSYLRRDTLRRKRESKWLAKLVASRRSILSRSIVLKVFAALIVFSLFATLSAGSVGYEAVALANAEPGTSSFSGPIMVNDNKANDQTAPVIIAVPGGRGLFVVWQDSRSGNLDIYTSVSSNGTSFAPNKRADDSIGTSAQKEPAVAVSVNDTILLTWQDSRRSLYDSDIFFTKSYNGGATFTKNVKVDDSTSNITWQERPSIAVTGKVVIYIAWTDDRTGILRVRGAFSTDGGATFSSSAEIAPSGNTSGQTGVALASSGDRIFVVFTDNISGAPHPYVCVSTNGGKSFSAPARLDRTGSSGATQSGVSIAPMPRGGIVAVWADSRNGNSDIYACIVGANGAIQTPDFRVDDDSTGAYQEGACVASDQLGNIFVTWEDERNAKFAIRFAYLKAGSVQFSPSVEVATPAGYDMQMRPSVVATEPGQVYVSWQDDRAGSYDIYTSVAYVPNLLNLTLVEGWNFVSTFFIGYGYKASTLGLQNGDLVSGWNTVTQRYDQSYVVGSGRNDFAISASTGYWIYANSAETLRLNGTVPTTTLNRSITVNTGGGWVTLGFASLNSTRHADDVASMYTGGSISAVVAYIPSTETYISHVVGSERNNFRLGPGEAYWIWVTASGTLAYNP
jgi:hypothetical protein